MNLNPWILPNEERLQLPQAGGTWDYLNERTLNLFKLIYREPAVRGPGFDWVDHVGDARERAMGVRV